MTAIAGPYYLAWANSTDLTFNSGFEVMDEYVTKATLDHQEGQAPTLKLTIKNPRTGLLNPSRKQWAWFACTIAGVITPLFFGQIIAIPSNLTGNLIDVLLTAQPLDWRSQKQTMAEILKVRPFWFPVFIDPAHRDDPEAILEGYSALWHFGRIDHTVTISDIIVPEDGTFEFQQNEVEYTSVDIEIDHAPITQVDVHADVAWKQGGTGTIDMGTKNFSSYADGIASSWPKTGDGLAGGWSVESAAAVGSNGKMVMVTLTVNYQNNQKTHRIGDVMSVSETNTFAAGAANVSFPISSSAGYNPGVLPEDLSFSINSAYITDNPDAGDGTPASAWVKASSGFVQIFEATCSLVLRYTLSQGRLEKINFSLKSDLQHVVAGDPNPLAPDVINISGTDVAIPIQDVLNWVAGEGKTYGQTVVQSNGGGFDICIGPGTTGSTEPIWSDIVGDTILDGTVTWVFIGSSVQSSIQTWSAIASSSILAGMIIRNNAGTNYQLSLNAGTTGATEPGFSGTFGTITADNGVNWVSLGNKGSSFGAPIGNPNATSFFQQDVGLWAIEYLISLARARLLKAARTVRVSFKVKDWRVIGQLSCRKGAIVHDPRLPGGQAEGKIVGYTFDVDGNKGTTETTITILCTTGNGTALVTSGGVGEYCDDTYTIEYQARRGQTTLVGSGDVYYSIPSGAVGGLAGELTKADVVISESVGDFGAQQAALNAAIEGLKIQSQAPAITGNQVNLIAEAEAIAHQLAVANIQDAVTQTPVEYELVLKPVDNADDLGVEYNLTVSTLSIPKQVDLSA